LNSETLLDGDSEKEEIIEITEFTETYRVLHAERGSFYRTSSRGAWHLHSWIPDEKGCTYRVLLQVPLPCSALPLTLDSDLLTTHATAARSGDLVDSQVSNLLGMWQQWGVLVDDLYQPASTDPLPVTPPSSGPEFSHAQVTTSTPHTEANSVQQSEGTLDSNAVLLKNDESTEIGISNTQECTCCAELSALKAKLRAISESKMPED
jgi:hypothetical protein